MGVVHGSLTELGRTMAVKILAVVLSVACSALADAEAGYGHGVGLHAGGHYLGKREAEPYHGYGYTAVHINNNNIHGLTGHHGYHGHGYGHFIGKREAEPFYGYGYHGWSWIQFPGC